PRVNGSSPSAQATPAPARVCQSTGFTPAARTRTRTSVGSGTGRAAWPSVSTPGGAETVLDDGSHLGRRGHAYLRELSCARRGCRSAMFCDAHPSYPRVGSYPQGRVLSFG